MTKPVRLQLSRKKGYRLDAASHAANGLSAIRVCRPGRWGNPYRIGIDGTAADCVRLFRKSITPAQRKAIVADLRGKNLACWCRPSDPCHGDVLLEIANGHPVPNRRQSPAPKCGK